MRMLILTLSVLVMINLAGCDDSGSEAPVNNDFKLLNLNLPDSLTGGKTGQVQTQSLAVKAANGGVGDPCHFHGEDIDDPFKNGYASTRFMVSLVAKWSCIADFVVDVVQYIPHDGIIHESENDMASENYDPGEPTHYRVVDGPAQGQVTLYTYYGYSRNLPPTLTDTAQFYLSWIEEGQDQLRGKLIVDTFGVDTNQNPEHPAKARMDFDFNSESKSATLYVVFDQSNAWADGFRVEVTRDLNVNPLEKVYTARGILALKRQFIQLPDIIEVPNVRLAAVANRVGNGASKAQLQQLALPLVTNIFTGDTLGNYIMDVDDIYYFKADINHAQPWDWIHKTASNTEYRGARNLASEELDAVVTFLGLPQTYFTSPQCESVGENCDELMNAIFDLGYAGREGNDKTNPNDWRGPALDSVNYLPSVYPNGTDWVGAFEQTFLP